MDKNLEIASDKSFNYLKIVRKENLTHNTFLLELLIPNELAIYYNFQAGQYVSFLFGNEIYQFRKDYSMVSAPYEGRLVFGIKINEDRSSEFLYQNYNVGDEIAISQPKGRFILDTKPHEFRTIIGFAAGIGITPILSHFKNILYTEPRTRLFLFYGNKTEKDIAFRQQIEELVQQNKERFQVYYFFSKEKNTSGLFNGRLDANKLKLIINQILHLDDTDEESTIWDAVDDVLICGKGAMIKEIASACYENGIPKKNIHFELFAEFNDDIFPQEKEYPKLENIEIEFKINNQSKKTLLIDNQVKILQQLLIQGFEVPYSCKSGICGSCICTLQDGEVELIENEYLTEKEVSDGKILACMAIPLSKRIKLNFDM